MNIAVILSGGSGSRFGSDTPKQYINLAGKKIIEYTIAVFEQNKNIDEICVVADGSYHSSIWELAKQNGFKKVKKLPLAEMRGETQAITPSEPMKIEVM